MTDQQTTTATFTNSQVELIKAGIDMIEGRCLGFDDMVKEIREKLKPGIPPLARIDKIASERIERLERALADLLEAASPYLRRKKMTPRPDCDFLNEKYRAALELMK